MTSLRHKPVAPACSVPSTEDLALDAARGAILAVGWSRTTLTDVARRAGLSRMTLYRRWPQMEALLADLMTREWEGLVRVPDHDDPRAAVVEGVVSTVRGLRTNELFARIVELDPELLLPYLLERSGRSQDHVLAVLATAIGTAQAAGRIRAGEPALLARTLLLTAHGFTLSAQTMTSRSVSVRALDRELAVLLDRYLRP